MTEDKMSGFNDSVVPCLWCVGFCLLVMIVLGLGFSLGWRLMESSESYTQNLLEEINGPMVWVMVTVLELLGAALIVRMLVHAIERWSRPAQHAQEITASEPKPVGPLPGRLIFLLVPPRSRESLIGDLEEEYRTEITCKYGRLRARCWWWKKVLGVAGPYVRERARRTLTLEALRKLRH